MPEDNSIPWLMLMGIIVILLILSGLVPQIFEHTQGNGSETFEQAESETIILQAPLEATITEVNNNPNWVTISVIDTNTGDFATTGRLNETESETVSIEGNDVTITNQLHTGANTAIIHYEYPISYEWDTVTKAFVGSIALMILIIFVIMIYIVMASRGEDL